ncbi:MAG: LTA synthase family protein [Bdellovibrionota bacterium]
MLSTFHARLLKRFSFLLVCYSLIRIGFYFYHLNIYKQFHQEDILESFLLGIRFDVAAICLVNAPVILLGLFPWRNRFYQGFERFIFVFLNFAAIVISLDDYELFIFMGKRLSFDLFVVTDDIFDQLPQLFLYYWYLPVAAMALCFSLYLIDRKWFRLSQRPFRLSVHVLTGLMFAGISFVGIRGGLQHKSINVQSAFTQGKNELGHLVLNSPYHFLRTLKNKSISKLSYFSSDKEAFEIILKKRDLRTSKTSSGQKNIVLIIMESFSLEYMEKGLMPFLSELKGKSLYFPYHMANGKRSIEALPAMLCGLPALLDEPLSKSGFQGNKFVCMPKLLKDNGYSNVFFHGGAKGTMGFEAYTLAQGFDKYYSKNDYPSGKDFDGSWGIYDGPFFQFFINELKSTKEPFLAGFFSLTSHHPYNIPSEFTGKFPKGSLEIHESIGYADDSLKKFFERAKSEKWYQNTLFVITGDHTSKLETKKFQNQVGRYRVPLLLFSPDQSWEGFNAEKVTQHADIPKTILDYAGVDAGEMPATGVSMLSGDVGYALYYADGQDYLFVSKDEVLKFNKNEVQISYHYNWDTGEMTTPEPNQDPILKAYLQYFQNGLISNNLSLYR